MDTDSGGARKSGGGGGPAVGGIIGGAQNAIYAAVSIYLDIINIFLYMLELLNACNNND